MTVTHRHKLQASYYNAVANTDWFIGQLQQQLHTYRIDANNSLQLYTSDHGESLFDDGVLGHGHQLSDTQTRVVWVSNRVLQQPALVAHNQLADVLLQNAWLEQVQLPSEPVLQVIGLLRAPQQVGLIDEHGRLSVDFRSKLVTVNGQSQPWALLSSADQQRANQLFTQWGWLRYQQSTVYQALQAAPDSK